MSKGKNTRKRHWILIALAVSGVFMFGHTAGAAIWPMIAGCCTAVGAFIWEIVRYIVPLAFVIFAVWIYYNVRRDAHAVWIRYKVDRDVRRIKRDAR